MGNAADDATATEMGSLLRSEQMSLNRCGVKAKTSPDTMSVAFSRMIGCLASLLEGSGVAEPSDILIRFGLPIQLRRRGVEAKLVIQPAHRQSGAPDPKLVALLADAHSWIDELTKGRVTSIRELALRYGRDKGEVSRTLPLAFLDPDIIEAVLDGRHPVELTPHRLKRLTLPCRWNEQRDRLKFRP